MHIIFFDVQKVDIEKGYELHVSLVKILRFISDSVMYLSVPKILLVLHDSKDSFLPIQIILTMARYMQFVDFTILQAIHKKPPAIFYYNVSTDSIEMQRNISSDLKLFPEKIRSMNGYKMRVGVFRLAWPSYCYNNNYFPMHLQPLFQSFKHHEYFVSF